MRARRWMACSSCFSFYWKATLNSITSVSYGGEISSNFAYGFSLSQLFISNKHCGVMPYIDEFLDAKTKLELISC